MPGKVGNPPDGASGRGRRAPASPPGGEATPARRRSDPLGGCGRRALERDAREAVQTDKLDQRANLRLGPTQQDRAPVRAQPPRQHREIEHQRGISEGQLREINDHIGLRAQGPRQGAPPASLGTAVLFTGTK